MSTNPERSYPTYEDYLEAEREAHRLRAAFMQDQARRFAAYLSRRFTGLRRNPRTV